MEPQLPVDASLFTSAMMDEAQSNEVQNLQKMTEEKDKGKREIRMREKAMAQMLKPPPPAVIKERIRQEEKFQREAEEVEKRKIMGKICKYVDRFPDVLDKIPKINGRLSLAESREILAQVHEAMNTAAGIVNVHGMFTTGLTVIERVMADKKFSEKLPERFRLNLKGLGNLCSAGRFPELVNLAAELDIEYPWLGRRSLIFRAIGTLGDILMKVHISNTHPEAAQILQMSQKPPVPLDDE